MIASIVTRCPRILHGVYFDEIPVQNVRLARRFTRPGSGRAALATRSSPGPRPRDAGWTRPATHIESGGKAAGEKLEALGQGDQDGESHDRDRQVLEKGGEKTHELLEKGGEKVKDLGVSAEQGVDAAGEKIHNAPRHSEKETGRRPRSRRWRRRPARRSRRVRTIAEEAKDLKDKAKDLLNKKDVPAPTPKSE